MPHYVPTELCLDSIYTHLGARHRSGNELLDLLGSVAKGNWPVSIQQVCPRLANEPGSTALAMALALLWPQGKWKAAEARNEFKAVDNDLSGNEPLRRVVDHATVCAIRREWEPAMQVLAASLLGDIPKHKGPVGAAIGYLHGLIPNLNRCWGYDFKLDGNSHVALLRNKLLQPFVMFHPARESEVEFAWDGQLSDEVVVRPFSRMPVPAGSRRNYRLAGGTGELLKNGDHYAWVATGQRLILRVLDDGKAELQIAYPLRGNVGGPELKFTSNDDVRLRFGKELDPMFEAWNCTCGALKCDQKHRLSAWNPGTMATRMTLASFLATAVKGPSPTLHMKSFIQGMYYALLCDGE